MLSVSIWIILSSGPAVAGLNDGAVWDEDRATLREIPDDPPGAPARPVPGAPLATVVTWGSVTHVQVNVDETGANIPADAANEPSIAVNPLDPSKIAIGWRQFDTVASNWRQAGWAYSADGGDTWTFPGCVDPGAFRTDPVLSFDMIGNFYYASMDWVDNWPQGHWGVDVFKSTDNGMSWSPGVPTGAGDKIWMTVDRSGGVGSGHVYVTWADFLACCLDSTLSRSVDGAQSFETPVPVPENPSFGTMDVAPDGVLYLSGAEWVGGTTSPIIYVSRSADAQDPLATPTFETVTVDMRGSLRGGLGYGPNPSGLLGQPWVAVDPSGGPTGGYIYLLSSVDPDGPDPQDVHFSRSTDGGLTWSEAVRVNDDPVGNGAWQWFGTMSVAPDGRIDAIWNDTRNTGVANASELFYAYSEDGGVTWSANTQLSPTWYSWLGFPQEDKIGDYYHMISDARTRAAGLAPPSEHAQPVQSCDHHRLRVARGDARHLADSQRCRSPGAQTGGWSVEAGFLPQDLGRAR
jgi:hypothetical protein